MTDTPLEGQREGKRGRGGFFCSGYEFLTVTEKFDVTNSLWNNLDGTSSTFKHTYSNYTFPSPSSFSASTSALDFLLVLFLMLMSWIMILFMLPLLPRSEELRPMTSIGRPEASNTRLLLLGFSTGSKYNTIQYPHIPVLLLSIS